MLTVTTAGFPSFSIINLFTGAFHLFSGGNDTDLRGKEIRVEKLASSLLIVYLLFPTSLNYKQTLTRKSNIFLLSMTSPEFLFIKNKNSKNLPKIHTHF